MNTPIYDFVKAYSDSDIARLHMPGHKGKGMLGCEALDITEISGADVLYSPDGIIAESEKNASELFGSAHTFYSTEGSTLCIKAMLALAAEKDESDHRPLVLAARNVHKSFIYAAALLDLDVSWLYPASEQHLCSCKISAEDVSRAIDSAPQKPCAVYLTSPDYLGNIADVAGIARVCDEFGIPLLVDNAHGAYLKFLPTSLHPLDLGASMCCDSAHKTLSVLTGGAYLHIAKKAEYFIKGARRALSLFASTSPSYLILQSLDLCNAYIADRYRKELLALAEKVANVKRDIAACGIEMCGDEPIKLTINACSIGYTGAELADELRKHKVECEFADDELAVLMTSVQNTEADLERVTLTLRQLKKKAPIASLPLKLSKGEACTSIRRAVLSASETVEVAESVGRICASPTVSCPPAVPIAISGEIITAEAALAFERYGIKTVDVITE